MWCTIGLRHARWIVAVVPLLACSCWLFEFSTVANPIDKQKSYWLELDATKRSAFFVGGTSPLILSEPAPDAAVGRSAEFSAAAELDAAEQGSLAGKYAETVIELSQQAETVKLAREALFRLSELYVNGALSSRTATGAAAEPDRQLIAKMYAHALEAVVLIGRARLKRQETALEAEKRLLLQTHHRILLTIEALLEAGKEAGLQPRELLGVLEFSAHAAEIPAHLSLTRQGGMTMEPQGEREKTVRGREIPHPEIPVGSVTGCAKPPAENDSTYNKYPAEPTPGSWLTKKKDGPRPLRHPEFPARGQVGWPSGDPEQPGWTKEEKKPNGQWIKWSDPAEDDMIVWWPDGEPVPEDWGALGNDAQGNPIQPANWKVRIK